MRPAIPVPYTDVYKQIPYVLGDRAETDDRNGLRSIRPRYVTPPKSLKILVFSEVTGFMRDEEDMLSDSVETDSADEGGSKNDGGCDAGAGGLAVLGAAVGAWKKRV